MATNYGAEVLVVGNAFAAPEDAAVVDEHQIVDGECSQRWQQITRRHADDLPASADDLVGCSC